ncbi:MAG: ABC transporter permease [Spirochaetales bacterium]|nr:ABC transporter permease [Spirochaetales bacterium]
MNEVLLYVLKRLLILVLTMILVSFMTFGAFSLISGDPARTILGTEATEVQVRSLRHELGLDRPFMARYLSWLLGFFSGNLGVSFSYRQPVWELVGSKLMLSLSMSLLSFLMIILVAIPLGVFSYKATGKTMIWLRTIFNQLGMAIPPFFTGIVFSWIFGILFRLFTPGDFKGFSVSFWPSFMHLFFGAVCLSIPRIAMTIRMMRSTVISEMNKAYVRTAISRGNDRRSVLSRHVLKNSLVSVISFLGQTLAELVCAGIVVEQVLGIPGVGRFLVTSILHRDYPVVQTIVVILTFWVVFASFIADIINQVLDPRLRRGQT